MIQQFIMSGGDAVAQREIEFIVSRFEKAGIYRYSGEEAELANDVCKELYESCRKTYEDIFVQLSAKAKMCVSQIYGGLEMYGRDKLGRLVFYVNPDSRCAAYTPIACHVPLLHTLTAIRNGGNSYLSEPDGEKLWHSIQKSFDGYIGRKQWEPQIIG